MKRLLICVVCLLILLCGCLYSPSDPSNSDIVPTGSQGIIPSIFSDVPSLPATQTESPVHSSCEQSTIAADITAAPESTAETEISASVNCTGDRDSEPRETEHTPKICIDPGHYAGGNRISGEKSYGYAEGDFTLQVALDLQEILMEKYGIDSCVTRTPFVINRAGYTIEDMDSVGLEDRVEVAKEQKCDFLFSIHTNANLPNANQYPTLMQPIQITKTIVLVNAVCCEDETWLAVANEVGKNLTKVNVDEGIAEDRPFLEGKIGDIPEWTDAWNDSLTKTGAVLCRHGDHGDYYGLLRYAAKNGLPAMIVEHGFHTVPEMRNAAINGNLAKLWAEADADGIAHALGILPKDSH